MASSPGRRPSSRQRSRRPSRHACWSGHRSVEPGHAVVLERSRARAAAPARPPAGGGDRRGAGDRPHRWPPSGSATAWRRFPQRRCQGRPFPRGRPRGGPDTRRARLPSCWCATRRPRGPGDATAGGATRRCRRRAGRWPTPSRQILRRGYQTPSTSSRARVDARWPPQGRSSPPSVRAGPGPSRSTTGGRRRTWVAPMAGRSTSSCRWRPSWRPVWRPAPRASTGPAARWVSRSPRGSRRRGGASSPPPIARSSSSRTAGRSGWRSRWPPASGRTPSACRRPGTAVRLEVPVGAA